MFSNVTFPSLPRVFAGKWNKKQYHILKELGRGAIGKVYLASSPDGQVAVKVGTDSFDLFMEVKMLRDVMRHSSVPLGPRLCDVDDLVIGGKTYSFYAMEYVDGDRLDTFTERAGNEWVPILMIQLLSRLEVIHRLGWSFGDIKPENIMVCRNTRQVKLIDFGGVSRHGNAIRQYTEDYDRGAWMAGDRNADPGYDLFSVACLMIRLTIGSNEWARIRPDMRHPSLLCDIIRKHTMLNRYREPLTKALQGKHKTALEMRRELMRAFQSVYPAKRSRSGSGARWIGGLFVTSLLALAGSLYYFWM